MLKLKRKTPLNERISFYAPNALNRRVRKVAARHGVKLSSALRQLIEIGLEQIEREEADNEQQK